MLHKISNIKSTLILLLFFTSFFAAKSAVSATEKLPIGTNLDAVNYWTPAMPSTDAMRMADRWVIQYKTGGGAPLDGIEFDKNGYPLSLPPYDDGINGPRERVAITYILLGNYDNSTQSARAPKGEYILVWEGEGDIRWGHHKSLGKVISETRSDRRIVRDYEDIGKGFQIRIQGTGDADGKNPISNIKLWMPGYENSGKIFTDWAIKDAQNYDTLRMMDWAQTNFSFESSWDERVDPAFIFQGKLSEPHFKSGRKRYQTDATGVAWEYIISFANQAGTNLWINIPAMADDNYVRQLARLMYKNFNPNAKLYIEYSNEIWNSGTFPAFNYCKDMGISRGYLGNSDNVLKNESIASFRFQGARSAEIFDIFYSEYNSEASKRLVRVIAGQATNTSIFENILNFEYIPGQFVHEKVDALAIAPYMGHKVIQEMYKEAPFKENSTDKETSHYTVDDIIARLTDNLRNRTKKSILNSSIIADKYGKTLIAYEGGQHLDNKTGDEHLNKLMVEAQYTEAMGDIYREFLGYWYLHAQGDLFANYTNITPCSKYGCWGVREFYDQTEDEAPKFKALMDVRNSRAIIATPEFDSAFLARKSAHENEVLFDLQEKNTHADYDMSGRAITYTVNSDYPKEIFSFNQANGQLSILTPEALDWNKQNAYLFEITATNTFASSTFNLDVILGKVDYDNLLDWQPINGAEIKKVNTDHYQVIRGNHQHAQALRQLPAMAPGDSIRVRFSARLIGNSFDNATIKASPYFDFAETGSGHIVIKQRDTTFYDVTYTNDTNSDLLNAKLFMTFSDDATYESQVEISDLLIVHKEQTQTGCHSENLVADWKPINGVQVKPVDTCTIAITRGENNYGQLHYALPAIEPGQRVNVQLTGNSSQKNFSNVALKIAPYFDFAETGGGHIVIENTNRKSYETSFINESGTVLKDGKLFFAFNSDLDAALDRVYLSDINITIE